MAVTGGYLTSGPDKGSHRTKREDLLICLLTAPICTFAKGSNYKYIYA